MHKDAGGSLTIELLRPIEWIEDHAAQPGSTIDRDLHEMRAVGEATVIAINDCPPIEPGSGTVVTGKFVHQCGPGTKLLCLRIEGQSEPTGVTDNHPYWSVDRHDFIPAGELRVGELVDTELGAKRVQSVEFWTGFDGLLYNLETTEHVFRVGSLGTLVHNTYAPTSTGGRSWTWGYGKIGDDAAEGAYQAIRESTTDVAAISRYTGYKPDRLQRIKNYLFNNPEWTGVIDSEANTSQHLRSFHMLKMVGCAAICILALCVVGLGQVAAAEATVEMQNGKYELRLLTSQMAKGKKDIALPAEVEVKDDQIVIQTQGMLGNKVTLKGMVSEGTIKVGVTELERSSILSFHYLGTIESRKEAKGTFHCFIDGKAAFAGEWVLTKKEKP